KLGAWKRFNLDEIARKAFEQSYLEKRKAAGSPLSSDEEMNQLYSDLSSLSEYWTQADRAIVVSSSSTVPVSPTVKIPPTMLRITFRSEGPVSHLRTFLDGSIFQNGNSITAGQFTISKADQDYKAVFSDRGVEIPAVLKSTPKELTLLIATSDAGTFAVK